MPDPKTVQNLALLEAHLRLGAEVHLHCPGVPGQVRTRPCNVLVGHVKVAKPKRPSRAAERNQQRRMKQERGSQGGEPYWSRSNDQFLWGSLRLVFNAAPGWEWLEDALSPAELFTDLSWLLETLRRAIPLRYAPPGPSGPP